MNAKTKKLITAGMLSDVLGFKYASRNPDEFTQEIDLFEIEDDLIKIYVCSDFLDVAGKPTLAHEITYISIYELKDKLEEWLEKGAYELDINYKDFSKGKGNEPQYRINITKLIDFDGRMTFITNQAEGETKLEALLKLYHAVKGET